MSQLPDKRLTVRSKIWLEIGGEPFLGQGRLEILRAIDRRGSITGAAQDTGISYRKIWGAIRDMERCIGHSLLKVQRGGSKGGGATLTEYAIDLMNGYERLQRGIEEAVDYRFQSQFKNFFHRRSAKSAYR